MRHEVVEYRSIELLKPSKHNARTHSERQIDQLANALTAFDWVNPVLVDENDFIITGHGRVAAAKKLGMKSVPTLRVTHLTDEQKRAYIIADNRLAELAGWDDDILRIELQELLDADLDFELTDIGFEAAEIDLILDQGGVASADVDEGDIPAVRQKVVAAPGDLWRVGEHRLLCSDALQPDSYDQLLGDERAQVVITDPPYNLRVSTIGGRGAIKHPEFLMGSGEMSEAEYTRFLSTVCRRMAAASVDGALQFICMDWRHVGELLRAGRIAYSDLLNICVWVKSGGGMGSLFRSAHEFVLVFKNGSAPHLNNVQLGRFGRNRTNVWNYPGLNSFQAGREEALAQHPTVKPLAMIADAILDSSKRRDIVLDPFLGSGTSMLAAHRTGRRCYAMEMDPAYVDVALRRVRKATGIEPICAATGERFSDREAVLASDS